MTTAVKDPRCNCRSEDGVMHDPACGIWTPADEVEALVDAFRDRIVTLVLTDGFDRTLRTAITQFHEAKKALLKSLRRLTADDRSDQRGATTSEQQPVAWLVEYPGGRREMRVRRNRALPKERRVTPLYDYSNNSADSAPLLPSDPVNPELERLLDLFSLNPHSAVVRAGIRNLFVHRIVPVEQENRITPAQAMEVMWKIVDP